MGDVNLRKQILVKTFFQKFTSSVFIFPSDSVILYYAVILYFHIEKVDFFNLENPRNLKKKFKL